MSAVAMELNKLAKKSNMEIEASLYGHKKPIFAKRGFFYHPINSAAISEESLLKNGNGAANGYPSAAPFRAFRSLGSGEAGLPSTNEDGAFAFFQNLADDRRICDAPLVERRDISGGFRFG
ncbi:hypothetical protein BpJC7_27270 [Weizmannia acidilactici]|uniref:Uncharacterized protein n=1 Tax=Weizmannia acidilactici TaxID=2607726 RepID=A0A5J4JQQ5_9BACI|nr:hypothetical protein BpJC7_27270 [Weizmannia acidilactici]GER74731.1 hypothetical protein BpPP18_27980 [Weizmannia acidilactici]